eukprot:scaffold3068_cov401-Prasinococcus_capsulatus_cf.AAC.27
MICALAGRRASFVRSDTCTNLLVVLGRLPRWSSSHLGSSPRKRTAITGWPHGIGTCTPTRADSARQTSASRALG